MEQRYLEKPYYHGEQYVEKYPMFLSQYWEMHNLIKHQKLFCIFGTLILFSLTGSYELSSDITNKEIILKNLNLSILSSI